MILVLLLTQSKTFVYIKIRPNCSTSSGGSGTRRTELISGRLGIDSKPGPCKG